MADLIHFEESKHNLDEIIKSNTNVLVDFTASWCGPCQKLAPILEDETKKAAGKFKLVKIDVDDNQETSGKFNISGIPFVVLFVNGNKVTDFTGANIDKLRNMIDKEMK